MTEENNDMNIENSNENDIRYIGRVNWFNRRKGFGFICIITPNIELTNTDVFLGSNKVSVTLLSLNNCDLDIFVAIKEIISLAICGCIVSPKYFDMSLSKRLVVVKKSHLLAINKPKV